LWLEKKTGNKGRLKPKQHYKRLGDTTGCQVVEISNDGKA
jgi:hypothetical protein